MTFWLATAPTPARAWAQRAATAGEEEEMTMPNIPVRGQRATRREGHSGITAVASISTSQSGRASATTTRPVET